MKRFYRKWKTNKMKKQNRKNLRETMNPVKKTRKNLNQEIKKRKLMKR